MRHLIYTVYKVKGFIFRRQFNRSDNCNVDKITLDNPRINVADISSANYVTFDAVSPIVGFQLNSSSDGMMLDGLPAL
ncbi:hypothetical protein KAI46_01500 [bacterium]|nr:hypothetical protein [bacterium]